LKFTQFCDNLDTNKTNLINAINIAKKQINTLLTIKDKNYNNFIKPFYESSLDVEKYYTMISHLNSVANSKKSQEIYSEVMPLVDDFMIDLSTNLDIYNAFLHIKDNDKNINKIQIKVLDDAIDDFILSGINLDNHKKEELKQIQIKLSKLSKDFSQNLIDANNSYELLLENFEDVKELPQIDLKQSKIIKDNKTYYKFTLNMPSYLAYMTYGNNRDYREQLYKAYTSRAPQNAKLIDEILELRDKKAKLLSFENFASLSISSKDANNVEEVENFLLQIAKKSTPIAKKEYQELKDYSKLDIQSYDIAYFSEKMKKQYHNIDEEKYMNYFELNNVLNYIFTFLQDSFNITIKQNTIDDTYHNKVKIYDFFENEKCFAKMYLDLENNDHKKGGAWMHDFDTHYIDSKGQEHLASTFIVCNFMPSSKDNPSLLKHSDIVTLFHEIGHGIHHIFSKVDELSLSGVNGVYWDVIEFPSQFLEQFAYDKNVLKSIGTHYQTKDIISDDMIDALIKAKNFQAGLGLSRQIEFSLFDLLLHKKVYQTEQIQDLLNDIRLKYSAIIPPAYNKFQNGFSHIFAGGYASGYYSYKWAEVLSANLYIYNEKKNILKEYKEQILYKGASENMSTLLENILHKQININDLFKLYGIKE
jgi:oligopeptidase A